MQESDNVNRDLVDAIKELSASIRKSSKNERKLEIAVALLAIVQIVIAGMQFIQSFAFSDDPMMVIWGIVVVIAIGVLTWSIFPKRGFES